MSDTITFLQGADGTRATKMWLADGTTADYDAGWKFIPYTVAVTSLTELAGLLTQAQTHANICVIRGTFRGDAHAQTVVRADGPGAAGGGWYRRWKELFDDTPHHWMCVDIDGYVPVGIDPVLEPERAIAAFIVTHLPVGFWSAGYHWQLSSSAGHARNAGVLKAHVWFWLDVPRTGAELEAWAPAAVDKTLYRVVQVHYTALPVFAAGAVDPVPVRWGTVAGGNASVTLTPAELSAVRDAADTGSRDMLDPRTKPGVIGAFCRAYSIEALLETTLADIFTYERGSDRRLTWLQGGGAVGGAYITDDRLHICNTHNTSPSGQSSLNAFDAVRVYCFGHLDTAPGVDPLALIVMQSRPSYIAMREWAAALPAVADAMGVPPVAPPVATGAGAADTELPVARGVTGETFLAPTAQPAYFANCVYVSSIHRILTPDGEVYDQQRFNAMFGGRTFAMDAANERTTRSAWECFLESQAVAFPKVVSRLFRPELPPYTIIRNEGSSAVNTYVPINTKQVEGDPEPFMRLLRKLLPVERDRDILLTYMASMLRNPGYKFQWWPVIQGCEGNGKSAVLYVMTHCVGSRYTEELNAGEMAKNGIKFNAWIVGTLFLSVEEVYVENRRHFLEEFKTIVTNKRVAVEQKGVDKTTEDNRANGIMCTNHEDGVPVTADSRRYAIFYTAQQRAEHKVRDGMDGNYFPDLYDWLNGTGSYAPLGVDYGRAVVNWWLRNRYVINPEFDPAGRCQVAPKTSSSAAAIKNSLGAIEQDILEAVEVGAQGFCGGWISSVALDALLKDGHRHIARNKRRSMLQSIGYDWHPHLREGRTTHGSPMHGYIGKFNLYAKIGSPICNLSDPKEITDRFFKDQNLYHA